jgi:hypothetical protein
MATAAAAVRGNYSELGNLGADALASISADLQKLAVVDPDGFVAAIRFIKTKLAPHDRTAAAGLGVAANRAVKAVGAANQQEMQ